MRARVIDLSTLSLVGGSGIAETRIPLWWADGTNANITGVTTAGMDFLADGSATIGSGGTSHSLFTLSSNWPNAIKYAFEATLFNSGNTSVTADAELWDMSSGTAVSGSSVSTNSGTATVIRSGQFTLTSGHSYGVTIWSTASYAYAIDASLIVFPS